MVPKAATPYNSARRCNPSHRASGPLVNKWAVTNEGRVWRLVLDELTLHNLAAVPSSLRLYTALHIAIADAELAARNRQRSYRRPHPGELDSGIHALVPATLRQQGTYLRSQADATAAQEFEAQTLLLQSQLEYAQAQDELTDAIGETPK